MPHNRFYLDNSATLTGNEFSHLKVTRPHVGDTVELVDGRGTLTVANIKSLGKREAELTLLSSTTAPKEPTLVLIQAIPRGNRLDTIVEKGTELGATAFWFFPGENSEKQRVPLERLKRITIGAMKQSGRLYLPELVVKPPLLQWTELPAGTLFGDLRVTTPLKFIDSAHLIIGPESGLSTDEIAHIENLGARGVSLHTNTLRTDTAAIVALAKCSPCRPGHPEDRV